MGHRAGVVVPEEDVVLAPPLAADEVVGRREVGRRIGAERLCVGGLALMGAGALLLSVAPARLGVAGYLVPIVVLTLGYALFQTANNTAVMAGARAEQRRPCTTKTTTCRASSRAVFPAATDSASSGTVRAASTTHSGTSPDSTRSSHDSGRRSNPTRRRIRRRTQCRRRSPLPPRRNRWGRSG